MTKQQAKENLAKLVEKYREVVEQGRVNEYNEEATKTAFIQPLLKDVLGWDVNDYNEVSPEERISRGRVDYCLKVEGKPKIFVEAKPLKADINKHIEQAVRYGYNRKGVPFVLLTDFEELMLFDVTVKPDIRNPNKGRKVNLFWKFYEMSFDQIWTLSKESVINGELDKLLLAKPKDRIPVDKAILDDLKEWRETLAKDIYKNNSELFEPSPSSSPTSGGRQGGGGAEYLKEITQRLLDRIIFMRFCEDRGFIHRRPLKELFDERTDSMGLNTITLLKDEFAHYNNVFDSDLFNPKEWEKDLQIDFKVMNKIVMDTYNPYQFDVIPLEVLGNIYEQYLGYTIRLTPQQVKYELKPDVRKAGGVYYTPEYIVDYIVKNTVGKLLKDTPQNKVKRLRILDPACGSGSFLIRAYEEMLNYYREQKKGLKPQVNTDAHGKSTPHLTSPARGEGKFGAENSSPLTGEDLGGGELQKELDLQHEATPRLTISEKAEILKNHIFGVDIDEQAVEVTKLSLMLKMLEGEFGIIPGRNILPMLDKNIRCGNSLISGSPLELKKYFGDDYYKVKPFNWGEEFKEIMDDGIASPKAEPSARGFDVVIGNPPYIFARDEGFKEEEKSYFYKNYQLAQYQLNTYIMFTEKAYNVLNSSGVLGFIIPNNWLTIDTTSLFRKFIIENTRQVEIVNIYDKVFEDANINTSILIFNKSGKKTISIYEIRNEIVSHTTDLNNSDFTAKNNYIISYELLKARDKIKVCKKIEDNGIHLKNLALVKAGIKAYEVGKGNPKQTEQMKKDRVYHNLKKLDNTFFKYIDGRDVQRYFLDWGKKFVKYGCNLAAPRTFNLFEKERVLIRQIPAKLPYSILGAYTNQTLINDLNSMIVKKLDNSYNIKYLLGVINSRLISFWFYYKFGKLQRKTFPQFKIKELSVFPIRPIDFSKTHDKKLHDNLVALVDVMLDLNKKIQTAKGSAKDQIQREITKTDNAVNQIVYKLYGITEGERKIIEGDSNPQ